MIVNLTRDEIDQLRVELTPAYTGRIVCLPEGVVLLDGPSSHWEMPAEVAEQAAKLGPHRHQWISAEGKE